MCHKQLEENTCRGDVRHQIIYVMIFPIVSSVLGPSTGKHLPNLFRCMALFPCTYVKMEPCVLLAFFFFRSIAVLCRNWTCPLKNTVLGAMKGLSLRVE